mmetsp:Transcript_61397/g.144479  ORF Transcript_61397/g.144479 Transcript_61397/m.144479 type:complete len:208 (-) Transcript_61397:396-1019(-)
MELGHARLCLGTLLLRGHALCLVRRLLSKLRLFSSLRRELLRVRRRLLRVLLRKRFLVGSIALLRGQRVGLLLQDRHQLVAHNLRLLLFLFRKRIQASRRGSLARRVCHVLTSCLLQVLRLGLLGLGIREHGGEVGCCLLLSSLHGLDPVCLLRGLLVQGPSPVLKLHDFLLILVSKAEILVSCGIKLPGLVFEVFDLLLGCTDCVL